MFPLPLWREVHILKIDKVYYVNLDSAIGRRYGQQVTARLAGVPLSSLVRWPAKNGYQYEKNEHIVSDIIADGFPEFRWFLQPENHSNIWQKPKNLAVSWSFVRALREVVQNKENAIILEDDTFLQGDLWKFRGDLSRLDRPVEVVWLETWRWEPDEPEFYQQIELDKEIIRTNVSGIYSNFYGLSSRARYFTYEGAQRFLDLAVSMPWYSHELVGWFYSLNGGDRSRWLLCNPHRVQMIIDDGVVFTDRDR